MTLAVTWKWLMLGDGYKESCYSIVSPFDMFEIFYNKMSEIAIMEEKILYTTGTKMWNT